jgi:NDP-sugar pyrophosphorylase family protein
MSQLANAGFDRVVLTLGHMAHLFSASYVNGERFGIRIDYVTENEPLGTAGSLRLIDDLEDNFLVMNGDILTTLDYKEMIHQHVAKKAYGTIALHNRDVMIDYGVVKTTDDDQLDRYIEKPTFKYSVSMGVNVLSKKCIDFIPENQKFDMPDLMLAMKNAGNRVQCFKTDCYWQDIGRFDDYQQASEDFTLDTHRFMPNLKDNS